MFGALLGEKGVGFFFFLFHDKLHAVIIFFWSFNIADDDDDDDEDEDKENNIQEVSSCLKKTAIA